jgi:hypothetical protein
MQTKIDIDGLTVTVTQAPFKAMAALFNGSVPLVIEGAEAVDLLLLADLKICVSEIYLMTDLKLEQIVAMNESQLARLAESVIAHNPRYFSMRNQLERIGAWVMNHSEELNNTPYPKEK